MEKQPTFSDRELTVVNNAVAMAEELVSNYYKMSAGEWLRPRYDIKTRAELTPQEIVEGPLAQIIRYEGKRADSPLGSSTYDFYKICLQDQAILNALQKNPNIDLYAFTLYVITHELIHIVRFSKFFQRFDASPEEKHSEEIRVHELTHGILDGVRVEGLDAVFEFYERWRHPLESYDG